MDAPNNRTGKIVLQEDASGWQTFSYGKLGEVTKIIRTFALPFEQQPYTFTMNFAYDSWNRIQSMTYPDGEVVSYSYNRGGMLDSIGGRKGSYSCSYINHIAYNEYELKDSVLYGNGSFAAYEYDVLMRLQRLQSYTGGSPAEKMQDITYTYDAVSNITSISNSANVLSNGLGGKYSNMYRYDNLYRLSYSQGDWLGSPNTNYELEMSYLSNGRISRKTLSAGIVTQTPSSNSFSTDIYDNVYHYNNPLQPNTLTHIDNSSQQILKWDNAGNMTYHRMSEECVRNLCWDEENRLQGVTDCNFTSYYQYDAGGERTYKLTGKTQTQNINGHSYMYAVLDNPTLYASPYLVATRQGYTKHYYADNERIASKIGSGGIRDIALLEDVEVFNNKQEANNRHIGLVKDCVGGLELQIPDKQLHILYKLKQNLEPEKEVYYYHPDHLGSSSWITHTDGSAIQHLHYLPYGEDFVNQKTTSFSSMYTFSAKEKDVETSYSYFGARYYNSALSIWLSVDPMAGKYPSMSPYVYCANNPIKLVDPNGKEWEVNESGNVREVGDPNNHTLYAVFGELDNFGSRMTYKHGKEKGMYKSLEVDVDVMSSYATNCGFSTIDLTGKEELGLDLIGFLSKNTNVEWSFWGGNEWNNKDNKEVSFATIGTSHEKKSDSGSTSKILNASRKLDVNHNSPLTFFIHSHPHNAIWGTWASKNDKMIIEHCQMGSPNVKYGIIHRGVLWDYDNNKISINFSN